MSDKINQLKKKILGHLGMAIGCLPPMPHITRAELEGPPGETFTLKEMREAYIKYLNGEALTDKELRLAKTKALAVSMCS